MVFYVWVFCSQSQYRIQMKAKDGEGSIYKSLSHLISLKLSQNIFFTDTFMKDNIDSNFFHKTFFYLIQCTQFIYFSFDNFCFHFLKKKNIHFYVNQLFRGSCSQGDGNDMGVCLYQKSVCKAYCTKGC